MTNAPVLILICFGFVVFITGVVAGRFWLLLRERHPDFCETLPSYWTVLGSIKADRMVRQALRGFEDPELNRLWLALRILQVPSLLLLAAFFLLVLFPSACSSLAA